MYCPKCGAYLSFKNKRCDRCNEDLKDYKKICSLSNQYYNDGLRKAQVRDLSGAIISLRNSLQIDKKNTKARNLLGLVYYEIGEVVLALSEWVLSKNYQEKDNEADYYMNLVQDNPSKLHQLNQNVKKYNYALAQSKIGNLDVAVVQLKKVIASQPKYLSALHLLALIYIELEEKEKAVKCLRKAQKIDINNTRTLYYLSSLGVNPNVVRVEKEIKKNIAKEKHLKALEDNTGEQQFFSPDPVIRDGKIDKWSFLYLFIGLVVGVMTVFFLVVPTMKKSISSEYNSQAVSMGEEQTRMASEILTLEDDKAKLEDTIDELNNKIKKMQEEAVDEALYDEFFQGVLKYIEGEEEEAAEILIQIDISKIEGNAAKELYNLIKADTFEAMSGKMYKEGSNCYNVGNYDGAVKVLKKALKYSSDNVNAMYFLGRSYQRLNDIENAKKYYRKIINDYPNDARVSEATRRLEEIEEE